MREHTHEQLVETGRKRVVNAQHLFASVDIEADGNPGRGSILSIGGIMPKGSWFYEELKPLDDKWDENQKRFCEFHGLNRERLMDEGTDPKVAIEKFNDWVASNANKEHKTPVMEGFLIGWDKGFIDYYCEILGLPKAFGPTAYLDQKSLMMGIGGGWDFAMTSKHNLPPILLPEGDFTHNALEDAIYQQELGFALAGLISLRN
jgi:hypothetical protein